MALETPIGLSNLPNEILITILTRFPTRELLPLTTISHRIHDLILNLIHHRILLATAFPNQKLIFECYPPSAKLSTPYVFCEYLGTDAFSPSTRSSPTPDNPPNGRLADLRNLYSHFRPIQPDGDRKVWRPKPTGGWMAAPISSFRDMDEEFVSQDIYLESHELFSQLQSVVNVVDIGPRKDFFLGCVTVGEGLVRVWRDWLAERVKELWDTRYKGGEEEAEDQEALGKMVLWTSLEEHIGLRVRVIPREDVRAPVLLSSDEDPNVGYTLQYEELVVRSTHLLLMIEQSLEKEISNTGKAVVIVS